MFYYEDGTPISLEEHKQNTTNYKPSDTELEILEEIKDGTFLDNFTETTTEITYPTENKTVIKHCPCCNCELKFDFEPRIPTWCPTCAIGECDCHPYSEKSLDA